MSPTLTSIELRALEEALREERGAAEERVRILQRNFDELVASSEGSPPDDEHDPEGATIGFERAQLSALLAQAEHSVSAAAAALDRIGNDTYGVCFVCGSQIPTERLSARPSAPTCVACAARAGKNR